MSESITVESCLAEYYTELRRIAPSHQASIDFTSTDSVIGFAPQQSRKIVTDKQLSNFVYNIIQNEAKQHAALMGPTVRSYDAARQKFSETLKRNGIGEG